MDLINRRSDLFMPADTLSARVSQMKPRHRGTFVIKATNAVYQYDVLFESFDQGDLRLLSAMWSKLAEDGDTVRLIDTCLIDLARYQVKSACDKVPRELTSQSSDSSAWSVELNACSLIDEVKHKDLEIFARSVSLDPKISGLVYTDNAESLLTWRAVPGLQVLSVTQTSTWQLRLSRDLASSPYLCDVSCFRTFHPQGPTTKLNKPRREWSLEVYHPTWDLVLAANAKLRIGQKVDKPPTVDDFFPGQSTDASADVSGFVELLDQIASAVRPACGECED